MNPPKSELRWNPGWRIIPNRYPPIHLFENVADPSLYEVAIKIESLTNPRLYEEIGDLSLVHPNDRVSGPGTSTIMAAFTHLNPRSSRFSDGSYGVFYVANSMETAIAETKYHQEKFLETFNQKPSKFDMRVYCVDVLGCFHDIRQQQRTFPKLYLKENYYFSNAFAKNLRKKGTNGIAYNSVRDCRGECIAIFRPPVITNVRQERHLSYEWNGSEIKIIRKK